MTPGQLVGRDAGMNERDAAQLNGLLHRAASGPRRRCADERDSSCPQRVRLAVDFGNALCGIVRPAETNPAFA